MIEVAI
jgi:hypothetical protein